ncbi:MAG: pimeloyl-ACP methyl ester carboxylesterase, partial [Verrucomicrobiales bacterium]
AVLASACTEAPSPSTTGNGDAGVAATQDDTTGPTPAPSPTQTPTTTTPDESGTTSTAPPALVDTVDWMECGQLECAMVDVPADYDDPSLGTIQIAINVLRAADTDRRLGVLMVNPGGPGASGKQFAEAFTFGGYPDDITDRFDIVGFDPRGVGDSEPEFACGASGQHLEVLAVVEDIYDTPEEIAAAEAAVQLCVESMGALAGRIHTDFVVRDMDEIRKAMGEEQITYLGYSYGSLIGTWYATLFPDRVRAMVIDGADNPLDEVATFDERLDSTREELQPIEDLLTASLEACGDPTCPIYNGGDPIGYYLNAVNKFELINEDNKNNPSAAFLAVITPLYNEASWPGLWEALADLQERDDPTRFSDFAVFQLGDDPGVVNNTGHINCLDSWALRPEKDREQRLAEDEEFFAIEDQLVEEFPLLGAIEAGRSSTCSFFDTIAPKPLELPLDGGGVPILVVGNTSDPVTSFDESEELSNEILSNGFLLEVDHPSHTVYPSNECVNAVVNDVLLDATYPSKRITCARE